MQLDFHFLAVSVPHLWVLQSVSELPNSGVLYVTEGRLSTGFTQSPFNSYCSRTVSYCSLSLSVCLKWFTPNKWWPGSALVSKVFCMHVYSLG